MKMQQYLTSAATQIPDDIARMASEQRLGAPQARFTITKKSKGWRVFSWLPLFAFGFVFVDLALMLIMVISDPSNLPILFISIFGILFSYFLFIATIIAYRITNKLCALYPCENGLILVESQKKRRVIRWEEVETLWQTSRRSLSSLFRTTWLYRLRTHDGYTFIFNGMYNLRLQGRFAPPPAANTPEDLEKILDEKFTRRHLPFWLADYRAGQTLNFGPLKLNREGIVASEKMLSWEQVADISLTPRGRLRVMQIGEPPAPWATFPAFTIPNLGLLLALFKRLRGGQSEQEIGLAALAAYGIGTMVAPVTRGVDALPDGLAMLTNEHRLGGRRVDQNLGRSRLAGPKMLGFLLILQTILLAGIVSYAINIQNLWANPAFAILNEAVIYSLIATSFLIYTIIRHFQQIRNHAYTFEHGMIYQQGKRTLVIWRWEDVVTTWRIPGVRMYRRDNQSSALMHVRAYEYKFQLRDGATYTLTNLNIDTITLSKIIQEQIVPLQLPAAITALQDGQTLAFGKVRINQQGLSVGEKALPWPMVKSVTLRGHQLAVYDITSRYKPWKIISTRKMPDLFLLFALADYSREVPH